MTESEMAGLNGQEFEQTPGDGEGLQSLVCCTWDHRVGQDLATEQQQQANNILLFLLLMIFLRHIILNSPVFLFC